MPVKTDRRDARGIAQLVRMGWYRPVHCKSRSAQEVRVLLSSRKLLLSKMLDIELGIRGVLRGFGLRIGKVGRSRFVARATELAEDNPVLEGAVAALLRARAALRDEVAVFDRQIREIVRADTTCRRLMTVSGVGALTALNFTSAIDDPGRFRKLVGAHFSLVPKKHQCGERDITGGITRAGDASTRTALSKRRR